MDHLPSNVRCDDLLNFIRALINLTVRVCVRYTSFARPQIFPGKNVPYPFYNFRGKKLMKTGTGRLYEVYNYTNENKKRKRMEGTACPCGPCRNSSTSERQWCMVYVITAQHVVFDDSEAQHTKCQLFYDSDATKKQIQELQGETMEIDCDIDYDTCGVHSYTHDLDLGKKLEEMVKEFRDLSEKLEMKFRRSVIEHPLTVIVSHPHGCSKQVTVGELTHREKLEYTGYTRLTYTTQTCPGSSGAPVLAPGTTMVYHLHSHCRRCEEDGFNMSGVW